jgi:hypothetical protein
MLSLNIDEITLLLIPLECPLNKRESLFTFESDICTLFQSYLKLMSGLSPYLYLYLAHPE